MQVKCAIAAKWRRWRALAALAGALLLSSCEMGPFWDAYASKTATMQLLTYVPCCVSVTDMPEHQTYYHLTYFDLLGTPGGVFVSYRDAAGKAVYTSVYLSYVAYVGLRDYTAIATGSPPYWQRNLRCGVLVVLPWGDAAERPFFIPLPPRELQAIAEGNVALSACNYVVGALFGFAIWLCLMVPGCLPEEKSRAFGPLIALLLLLGATAVVFWATVGSTWQQVQAALDYYRFFDALPRVGAGLLPLSWSETAALLRGPPYPPVTSAGDPDSFLWVLWIGYAAWTLGCADFIADGLAAWLAPDFIGELQDRVAREGRAVTPADIADVVTRASGTLSARQLARLGKQLQGRIGHER
jgi:hypothetical protein